MRSGGEVPVLPDDVFNEVASYFTVRQWAQGPAQACRSLDRMHLTHLVLEIPKYNVRPPLLLPLTTT